MCAPEKRKPLAAQNYKHLLCILPSYDHPASSAIRSTITEVALGFPKLLLAIAILARTSRLLSRPNMRSPRLSPETTSSSKTRAAPASSKTRASSLVIFRVGKGIRIAGKPLAVIPAMERAPARPPPSQRLPGLQACRRYMVRSSHNHP